MSVGRRGGIREPTQPPYIEKPTVTKPPRDGGRHVAGVYEEFHRELEAIVRKPNSTWMHVDYFMRVEGYQKFRPARIYEYVEGMIRRKDEHRQANQEQKRRLVQRQSTDTAVPTPAAQTMAHVTRSMQALTIKSTSGRLRRPVTQERVKMPTVTTLDIYDVSVLDSMLPPPKKKRLVRQH